ncbi:recombinase family protein, partial [Corynebacterium sp. AOP12-C2-36]|uniref:recombinase family protein n=1 Tax=Corynebacterium sp. AOP12-C2-36 TaxID=3457723 RepID=UPI004034A7DE
MHGCHGRRRCSASLALLSPRTHQGVVVGEVLGYARVSTTDQDARLQHDALTKYGCARVFTDTASGTLAHRDQFVRLSD